MHVVAPNSSRRIIACIDGTWNNEDGREGIGVDKTPLEAWNEGITGAGYAARVVADLLHRLTLKQVPEDKAKDMELWSSIKRLARLSLNEGDVRRGQEYRFCLENTRDPPKIKFLVLFDTVKMVLTKDPFNETVGTDVSFVEDVRHALALNEERRALPLLPIGLSEDGHVKGSYLQAWFVGAHADMGGGAERDGLSLYPLQWMFIESKSRGLVPYHEPPNRIKGLIESPLDLAFPESSPLLALLEARAPVADTGFIEQNLWTFRYSSRAEIIISTSHWVNINSGALAGLKLAKRQIFDAEGFGILQGYNTNWMQKAFKGIQGYLIEFRKCSSLMPMSNGVGKSTLLNRVLGIPTTEVNAVQRGKHDITKAFGSDQHPGIIFHDSEVLNGKHQGSLGIQEISSGSDRHQSASSIGPSKCLETGIESTNSTATLTKVLCREIAQGSFGLPETNVAEIDKIHRDVVWMNLAPFIAQNVSQSDLIRKGAVYLTMSTDIGGISLDAGAMLLEAPAAARMIFKCACDLILILENAYRYYGKTVGCGKIKHVAKAYIKSKVLILKDDVRVTRTRRRAVHGDINELIPTTSKRGEGEF
ncbi:hypothetical protein BDP55DRAFT_759517 [Colletotrichum godetiae]|uniref:T6SS Phospholipase effector Tle1-like catalytic domain-containing protein n=1 Tax=Colletotrichum godetiae TaxID=1209918 RepID=A0AAJ0F197_9PEZI|nr:uncharacterized protein BDP55DRAFT_759517 [Colletotrichum godetiae]KAK1689323.1 hypothetical protein BDP55DRAFT_759517 [Colletotrichum godetiae]